VVEQSQIAQLPIHTSPAGADPDGMVDYHGNFDPEFRLESLATNALPVVLREFAIQSHLLLRSLLLAVTQRLGEPTARAMTPRLVAGWGGLTAQRLRSAFGLPANADGLAAMLRLHPMFHPAEYVGADVVVEDDGSVRLSFGDGAARSETDHMTWLDLPDDSAVAALAQLVQAFDPHASLVAVDPRPGGRSCYRVTIDADADAAADSPELQIAKISLGASFTFANPTTPVLPFEAGLV
jgi:hypothetical protein